MATPPSPKQQAMLFRFQMASTALVQATPQQVWGVFRDAASWPGWSRVCTQVWGLSPDLWADGSRLSFRLRMGMARVPFSVQVTVSDPPHRVAWASTKFTITAVRTFTFEEEDGETLVTDGKAFSSTLLPIGIFYPRWLIRNMTEAWLRDLKAETERRVAHS
ncbi:MAG: SRPBCC family protein [Chloroflexi bacterium]|nr:SRPBCC family protein [Chloroflexota bacterium]